MQILSKIVKLLFAYLKLNLKSNYIILLNTLKHITIKLKKQAQ